MTGEVQVWYAQLHSAARTWDDERERLTGARTSLGQADAALLGSRVAPAARAFLATWSAEVSRLERAAGDHADALRDTGSMFAGADALSVEQTQQLLPFTERASTPSAPYGGAR